MHFAKRFKDIVLNTAPETFAKFTITIWNSRVISVLRIIHHQRLICQFQRHVLLIYKWQSFGLKFDNEMSVE